MSSWVKNHFEHLKRWREYAEKIAKAAKEVLGEAEIYVVGGVAEERTTIYSDIDIEAYGLPWDVPVELHIVNEKEAREYLRISKKAVKIVS